MQITYIIRIISLSAILGILSSCSTARMSSVNNSVSNTQRIKDTVRYNSFIVREISRYRQKGDFFCIYDLDFRRCVFIRYVNNKLVIDCYRNRKKSETIVEDHRNPFSSLTSQDIQSIKKEMQELFPELLDGPEVYVYVFWKEKDEIEWCIIEDVERLLSAEFNNSFLTDIKAIIQENRINEILYE